MEKRVSKRRAAILTLPRLPRNVLPFPAATSAPNRALVLYLSGVESLLAPIRNCLDDQLLAHVDNREQLAAALKMGPPELVLLDSEIDWSEPLELMSWLHQRYHVPIVLLVRKRLVSRRPSFIRRSYAAGITDVVYLPLAGDDLTQTISVLLRARREITTGG